MVFGVFIDVPLLTLSFLAMLRFRKRVSTALTKLGLPPISLYMILSVPLIIFEEDIDCQPSWCGTVVIPPTLPFLLVEMLAVGVIAWLLHAKSPLRVTLIFSIYGVLFEIVLGGLRGAPIIITALLAPYVALGYAFISMLPLMVLLAGRGPGSIPSQPSH